MSFFTTNVTNLTFAGSLGFPTSHGRNLPPNGRELYGLRTRNNTLLSRNTGGYVNLSLSSLYVIYMYNHLSYNYQKCTKRPQMGEENNSIYYYTQR